MQIQCPKCKQQYDVEISLVGERVECICGYKWILREKIPSVIPARSLNEHMQKSIFDYDDLDIEEACSIVQKYRAVMGEQYAEYWKIAQSRKNDPLDVAYEKAKAICVSGNPVPAAYGEFFKLCRKKNIADKRAKKYQAVVDRIALMLILDKKQLDVIWLTNAMHNGIKRSVIDEHYSLITITDKKNFKVCKELLKKC